MSRSRALVAVINSKIELLDLFGEIVEGMGYSAVTFEQSSPIDDTSQVIRFLADLQPDVIVFDIAPPYEENWRACETVHQQFAATPLVVVTTNVDEVQSFAQDLPVLEKPFFTDDLARVLLTTLTGQEGSSPAPENKNIQH